MSTSKKVTLQYFNIQAAEEDYFRNLQDNAEQMLDRGNTIGMFETGTHKFAWELLERVDVYETPLYLFRLVKERPLWPAWVSEEGKTAELSLPGILGEPMFGMVNPAHKFIVLFGAAGAFKKLLGQFSPEGIVRLVPFFEDFIDEKVLAWDSYKKVSVSINLPSNEDVTEFSSTKAGQLMRLLEFLGGLKVDISVSSGAGKGTLSNMMVKDLLPELLANDLCKSLTVKGSDFENAAPEQYDLKNAQIKYSEMVEIEGRYIMASDAKQIFMRALNERYDILFGV